jgi:16S rRNA (cytosine967-C5)-methyltransferase
MRSSGQIFACDVSGARLRRMKPRLARSGATNVQPFGIDSERDPKLARLAGRADAVLVDAPCSGTGTLRRNPDLKWRLDPADVTRLVATQNSILAEAAKLVKKGGALVYATCSLLDEENEGVAAHFEAQNPGWERDDPRHYIAPEYCGGMALRLLAHRHDTDCFFAARWIRRE